MKKIYVLTDYKGFFGSKYVSHPYRSGFDKDLLKKYFWEEDYDVEFIKMVDAYTLNEVKNIPIIYTSSEDIGFHYKSFIEDVVLFLKSTGAIMIPDYEYLRANNNKSFMELFGANKIGDFPNHLNSWSFGTLEEMINLQDSFNFPVVLKSAAGAMGKGVYLARNQHELIKYSRKLSRTKDFIEEIKDFIRSKKHPGYTKESTHRNKFVIQEFIPGLINDWKVYVFGNKYYVFYRPIFKNRKFKASGGGYENYYYGNDARIPSGLLDYSKKIFDSFTAPHASFDVAYDGNKFYLLEYQFIYFGTAGILYSKEYFEKENNSWITKENKLNEEKCYVQSIVNFIDNPKS